MSYINDALKKAQRERDNRYGKFGGIIAAGTGVEGPPRKRWLLLFTAGAIILAVALALPAIQTLRGTPPAGKPAPPSLSPASIPPPAAAVTEAGQEAGAARPIPPATQGPLAQGGPPAPATAVEKPGGTKAPQEAETRYREALLAQRKGDLARAEALYREALSLDGGHVRALNNLGVIYLSLKEREKAASVLNRAIALKKDYVDPYYNLACLHAQASEIQESLRYLKAAAALDGRVVDSARKDADMKNVVASPEFKKLMEGQKN
jgi:tetratricopeptide (TPR) repeat protein